MKNEQLTKATFICMLLGFAFVNLPAQTPGTFVDKRDGQTYKTIYYGENLGTWMAENLNYKMEGSIALDYNEANRSKYWLLYTHMAAQEACPNGWHLPSSAEWQLLFDKFGGYGNEETAKALKAENGWYDTRLRIDYSGTNSSGFTGLPSGKF